MISESMKHAYLYFREKGFRAAQAYDYAMVRLAWEKLEEKDLVRFSVVPDDSGFDVQDLYVDEDSENDKNRIRARVERDGIWGIVSEVRCPCCGQWTAVDSVWGFVGDDFVDSGYDWDVKAEAIKAALNNMKLQSCKDKS